MYQPLFLLSILDLWMWLYVISIRFLSRFHICLCENLSWKNVEFVIWKFLKKWWVKRKILLTEVILVLTSINDGILIILRIDAKFIRPLFCGRSTRWVLRSTIVHSSTKELVRLLLLLWSHHSFSNSFIVFINDLLLECILV